MTAIRIYTEKKSSHRAEISRTEKNMALAKAANQPYLAIRPRSTCCTVVCDWRNLYPVDWRKPHLADTPPAARLFARQVERHLDAHWLQRRLQIRPVAIGATTQIDRVPAYLARQLADELAHLAETAMRETGCWVDPPPLGADLPAYDTGQSFIVWCAHCEKWHTHGRDSGHRRPHCWVEDSPYQDHGYNLIPAGIATPAILKDYRRRHPQGPATGSEVQP